MNRRWQAQAFGAVIAFVALTSCTTAPKSGPSTTAYTFSRFPPRGHYVGDLKILGRGTAATQTVKMDLNISPTESPDRWHWILQYEGQPARDYELVAKNPATGDYVIDEKNGIVLGAQLIQDTLYSAFELEGGTLVVRYQWLDEETVVFELDNLTAQSTTTGGGTVPVVKSIMVGSSQRGILKKVQ